MNSLFNRLDYDTIRTRIKGLTVTNKRNWGKMDIAQMLAHCSIGFEQATGKIPFKDKSNFIMRVIVKRFVIKAIQKGDLGKNQKTFPDFEVTDKRDFDIEKARLLKSLDDFYKLSYQSNIGRHPYFGNFTKDNWGILQFVHTDHHLKQFSA